MKISMLTNLILHPSAGWEEVKAEALSIKECYARYVIPLALIAPIASFIGTSMIGWRVGGGDAVRLTTDSALKISVLTFFAMLVVVYVLARTIHWMARTYDSEKSLAECFFLAAFTAVPLFLVGITMIYPMPWFVYLLGLPALGYSVALLYTGVPVMMEVNKEQGFLFSSAILALGLVSLVGLIVVSVSFWGFGAGPCFPYLIEFPDQLQLLQGSNMNTTSPEVYNYKVVRQFALMTVVWGVVGMLVGVIIAAQLVWPALNFDIPYLSFGRLRPLHTNAVIFAFGGCALFATSYYVVQRTCHTRLALGPLAAFTFWGWNLVIVLAAITLPLGITFLKEYAELEWPIDILITLVWVAYALVFFGTIHSARSSTSTSPTGSSAPSSSRWRCCTSSTAWTYPNLGLTKSYSLYAGVQDAMVQWWYGHNAVGFFLTAASSGIMYYFIPKQANRPVYSYRLSVVHFWALIFTYIWAGPHHLHYTALPDWAQSLGMVFSLILLAPSWGGMINGIMTLSGAWHKLRTDPILKFL